ncbi:succinate dehydrogenase cytochrome b subunit [Flavobacterium sp. MAH-1]|uniref:Succinate dehydrogenase cytochrome b subunit n=1 Tax=Flavobacterium agri TaxID=2743471 RepID=A0A7Y8Y0W4_9FLAO|nr:succinate dehydrogenase cytochrome b subunit [Flavobacterium agri]NUY80361.1 succinate dehydrogenase cytochrome b subunit [Flavobacterium agri]NYA70386.1 succinate dehydrogenase cytochrome b subunit [Flavobacterium agri]
MKWILQLFTSSLGKKITMALTGLFLISFLIVHAAINGLIFYNDGGKTFNIGAHFMGTNPIIRTLEIVLILGFLIHIFQGLYLWKQNRDARPVRYAYSKPAPRVTWYSRSMALLGTLILLFLVVHTSNFWIPNRLSQFRTGEELPLYEMMLEKFSNPIEVTIYVLGCFSLFWHLLHGFSSAFQTLGLSHYKYDGLIWFSGVCFSILIPSFLAMMPISMYFGWIT